LSPSDINVSAESITMKGMKEHRAILVIHIYIKRNNEVLDNVVHFLKTGIFIPEH